MESFENTEEFNLLLIFKTENEMKSGDENGAKMKVSP